jgi:hypothetical protein
LKLVFQGSVAKGFEPVAAVENHQVHAYLQAEVLLPEGCTHREFINVEDVVALGKSSGGTVFVLHASDDGPGNGVTAYGPFPNEEIAENFAESTRKEDCEYSIVELQLWSKVQ